MSRFLPAHRQRPGGRGHLSSCLDHHEPRLPDDRRNGDGKGVESGATKRRSWKRFATIEPPGRPANRDLHAHRLCERRTIRGLARRPSRVRGRAGRPSRLAPARPDRCALTCRPAPTRSRFKRPGYRRQVRHGGRRCRSAALPVPPPVRRPAWLRLAQVGAGRRERSEFRVHSVEPYHLALWRYGLKKELVRGLGWFDEHGPRATMQITPDGDYTQTGVRWNKHGYANPHLHQYVKAPGALGPLLLPRPDGTGRRVRISLDRRPGTALGENRRAGFEYHLERLQQLRRPEQLH